MAITNYQVAATVSTGAYASSGDNAITVIYITNKSATDGNVDVYLVPSANVSSFESSPSQNYKIYITAPDSAAQFNATISTIGL